MTNLDRLLPTLRDMLRKEKEHKLDELTDDHPRRIKQIEDEYFIADAGLVIGADVIRDIHRIADALQQIAKNSF